MAYLWIDWPMAEAKISENRRICVSISTPSHENKPTWGARTN